MKQMTKEELIEYFIEQLGDNEILGQVMTIEQIRDKLNRTIKSVTYNPEKGSCYAAWESSIYGDNTLNFDINKIPAGQEAEVIVHEMLHVLSTSLIISVKNYKSEKIGLHLVAKYNPVGETYFDFNRAINEGMTDYLAEKITGQKNAGYSIEKSVYKILSIIIGEKAMLSKYFEEIDSKDGDHPITLEKTAKNIFKDDIIKQYGAKVGTELHDDIKKVLSLADQLNILASQNDLYGLNQNGMTLYHTTKKELYDTLSLLLQNVISCEQDLQKLIKIQSIIKEECSSMSNQEQILESVLDKIYDFYIKNGKISEESFSKRNIFHHFFLLGVKGYCTIDELDQKLDEIKWQQAGDYYQVFIEKGKRRFDSEGNILNPRNENRLCFLSMYNSEINMEEQYGEKLLGAVDEENISILMEQLVSRVREFPERYKIEKTLDDMDVFVDGYMKGKTIHLKFTVLQGADEKGYEEFYSVSSDGLLEQIQWRRRKKIYR